MNGVVLVAFPFHPIYLFSSAACICSLLSHPFSLTPSLSYSLLSTGMYACIVVDVSILEDRKIERTKDWAVFF